MPELSPFFESLSVLMIHDPSVQTLARAVEFASHSDVRKLTVIDERADKVDRHAGRTKLAQIRDGRLDIEEAGYARLFVCFHRHHLLFRLNRFGWHMFCFVFIHGLRAF